MLLLGVSLVSLAGAQAILYVLLVARSIPNQANLITKTNYFLLSLSVTCAAIAIFYTHLSEPEPEAHAADVAANFPVLLYACGAVPFVISSVIFVSYRN